MFDLRAERRWTNQEHFRALIRSAETASDRVADIDQMTRPEGDPVRRSIVMEKLENVGDLLFRQTTERVG